MSNLSRRNALLKVKTDAGTHAGLWLDRYLSRQTKILESSKDEEDKAKTARTELIADVDHTIKTARGYRQAFDLRFESIAVNPQEHTIICAFRCIGRMVIGLGQKGVLENGITLERAWGVPFLPGPALKGVAASTAHQLIKNPSWRKGSNNIEPGASAARLFGTTEEAGRVTFHDAWWVADTNHTSLPLHTDVITVHNSHYYKDKKTPDGMCSPIPVPFLSASGTYLVMLSSSKDDAVWADAAMEILTLGLRHLGIGAKTNAGYGRFEPDAAANERWHDRLGKIKQSAELSQKSLDTILDEAIADSFNKKNGIKTFADNLNKIINGNHRELAELFYNDRYSRALESFNKDTIHTNNAQARDALKTAMRANPIVQGWIRGEHNSKITNPRGSNWMKKAASWAGIEEDQAVSTPNHDPLQRFPNAQNLPEDARKAFLTVFAEDGSVDENKLDDIFVIIEVYGDEALLIYENLLGEVSHS